MHLWQYAQFVRIQQVTLGLKMLKAKGLGGWGLLSEWTKEGWPTDSSEYFNR